MSEVVKLTIVSESAENQSGQIAQPLTVGERLALARSQQELSVEQVAGQLKWSTRQIAEIEAGHYSVFPDMLTVRGFVRTYAKILKIDSASLLQDLATEYEKLPTKPLDRPKLDTPFPTGRMPLLGRHHNSSQKILGGVILLALCLIAVFVWRAELLQVVRGIYPASAQSTKDLPSDAIADQNSQVGVKPKTQENISELTPVEDKNSATPESKIAINSEPTLRAGFQSQQNIQAAGESAQIERQKSQQSAEYSSANALVLSFKQDSWIQIKRLDGSIVTSRLYKAGSDEVINVTEPMNMVIGNAPGVDAKLRGQNLILATQPGSNVVNLSIK